MARPRWLQHPGVRRLPLLIVAAIGIWMWQAGAKDRDLYWELPEDRARIDRVLIQVRDKDGALLKGDELFFEDRPPPPELRTKARLADGTYDARITLGRRDGSEETLTRSLRIEGETAAVRLR